MLTMASKVADWSLVIGVVLLGVAILGGVFTFIRLGLYSSGLNKLPAAVISGVLIMATIIFFVR